MVSFTFIGYLFMILILTRGLGNFFHARRHIVLRVAADGRDRECTHLSKNKKWGISMTIMHFLISLLISLLFIGVGIVGGWILLFGLTWEYGHFGELLWVIMMCAYHYLYLLTLWYYLKNKIRTTMKVFFAWSYCISAMIAWWAYELLN
ncbi:hypothetical protein G3578_03355 [Brevibacillus sp. SYP-B805]|uniref:hypothetical protein n=1 Tax=Brevibacillus sp. SYP-B805 TaxID=1578199 RepID=UPI0013ECDFBF|nr:hypothetical protein [Brevibacillus sp. SYP-B805]NGQ94211.1 hypothetical protein [Brevibacillus sp. SYP-B805]